MSWYNDNHSEWKEIIETVAGETGRSREMVEKDTIQSVFLFQLSKEDLPFVFKGCQTGASGACLATTGAKRREHHCPKHTA